MVDETDGRLATIDRDAAHDIGRIVPRRHILQRIAVDDGKILDIEPIDAVDFFYHMVVGLLQTMRLGIVEARLQSLIDARCNGTLVGREQRVAAAACQSVVVAHDGTLHNLHGQTEMPYHRLHDSNLLPVLLTEIGAVGAHNIKKTAHHLAYAIEMTGPVGSLHHR